MNPLKQYIKQRLERLETENDFLKEKQQWFLIKNSQLQNDLNCDVRILKPLKLSLNYDEDKDHCIITIEGTFPTEIHLGRMGPEELRELQNFITRLNVRRGKYLWANVV